MLVPAAVVPPTATERVDIRMGRAATVSQGINWLTLFVVIAFILARLRHCSSSAGNGSQSWSCCTLSPLMWASACAITGF